MSTQPLTQKQERFYTVLSRYISTRGESPTVAELQKLLHLSSPRAVTQYLEVLERKGYIHRNKYEPRGIQISTRVQLPGGGEVSLPVIASAGCDNLAVFAERTFDEYVCVARELLGGRRPDNLVSIRAMGNSMEDAGIGDGDLVLVEITEKVSEDDLVVAIVDSNAVIKKIQFMNNAIVLQPVSSDPQYRPIVLRRDFRIFGKVIDVLRDRPRGELEVVPVYSEAERRDLPR
ncbi:MAG: repressor LexA [Candidatus Liptonbacteria bacterium]|nr:repressor LexA [Candidatus Liptonbacteria bacterium]